MVATDITARNQALNALEQARAAAEELAELRSDFVATVSHELRTPLTLIVGYAQILQACWQDLSPAKQLDQIIHIVAAANRLRRLVEDLLVLSRLESRTLAPDLEKVSLALLVQEAADETLMSYEGQRINLAGAADVQVLADRARTLQVLTNLMDNAAKYSPEGSAMTVSWDVEGRWPWCGCMTAARVCQKRADNTYSRGSDGCPAAVYAPATSAPALVSILDGSLPRQWEATSTWTQLDRRAAPSVYGCHLYHHD